MEKSKIYILIFFYIKVYAIPFEECFINASKKYNVPKEILISIASVESKFKQDAINRNSNGSYDLGIMQINSIWFSKLSKIGISKNMLHNPCQNIMVGAWVLAQNIENYGFNWQAIQRYNGSDTQLKYAKKVYLELGKYYPDLFSKSKIIFDNNYSKVKDLPKNKSTKKAHFVYIN